MLVLHPTLRRLAPTPGSQLEFSVRPRPARGGPIPVLIRRLRLSVRRARGHAKPQAAVWRSLNHDPATLWNTSARWSPGCAARLVRGGGIARVAQAVDVALHRPREHG